MIPTWEEIISRQICRGCAARLSEHCCLGECNLPLTIEEIDELNGVPSHEY